MAQDSSPRRLEPPTLEEVAERNRSAAEFLHRSGLLFELNRVVLQPLGLALSIWENDDGAIVGFAGLANHRDDPEGMIFSEETLRSGLERLRAYGVARIRAERERRLGYVVQPLPEEP